MAQHRNYYPSGPVIDPQGASIKAAPASNDTADEKSTNSAWNGAQQQAPLNTTFQSPDKALENGGEKRKRKGRRKFTPLKNLIQSFRSREWPAYPRKEGFDDIKVLMNQRNWSSFFATTQHLLAIASAVIIVTLNASGLWVGKELTGKSGKDTEKLLALQFAAKLHELLILSSLGQILFSQTVKQVVFGEGLPLGAITAGLQFNQISYLWSEEFKATSCATFNRKHTIVPIIIICTLLGVSIGPSSATAIRPTLGEWPAGETSFWLNATAQELWPSTLSLRGNETCANSPETCGSLGTWTSLADNFLKYWGHEALGNIRAMPESVQIPDEVSIRTLNARFRGPFTLYQPEFTTTTIQPVAIANVVNTIRQIWLRANGARCYSSDGIMKRNFCTYQDITWSVDVLQPAVFVACNGGNSTAVPKFPTFASGTDQPTLIEHAVNLTNDNFGSDASFITWVDLPRQEFIRASVGALVKPASDYESIFACTIDAQWANATIQSSFLGLPYIVNGVPPHWYQPQDDSSGQYHSRHVNISPAWALLVNPPLITPQNTSSSPFDILLTAMSSSGGGTQYMTQKIEAILAILFADRMGRVSADATLQGEITDINQVLQISGGMLFEPHPSDSQYHSLSFQTAVTGYAYGLRGKSGIIISTLVSIIILLCYVAIAVTHLLYTHCISGVFVSKWQTVMDLVALAFHSDITHVPSMRNTSTGIKTTGPLKTLVVFRPMDEHIELVFVTEPKGNSLENCGQSCISDDSTPDSCSGIVRHRSV